MTALDSNPLPRHKQNRPDKKKYEELPYKYPRI